MSKAKIVKLSFLIFSIIILLFLAIIYKKNKIDYGNGSEDLEITNGKIFASGNYDYKSITINGGIVTVDSADGGNSELILRAKKKIIIKNGAEINLSKKGYAGSNSENNAKNVGLSFELAGGGGSHGGLGGSGNCIKKESTKIYGFNDIEKSFGEGGGISLKIKKGQGGDGGGYIKLIAPEITIDGKIISSGGDGTETGGGGAGGKIVLMSRKIILNGSIEAIGGKGGTSLFQGAGGGGGGIIISNVSFGEKGLFIDGGLGGKAIDYYSGCGGINGEKGKFLLSKK